MNYITPSAPSYVFGYWRPWKENSNALDSYLDYAKDVSLAKYSADVVGNYINEASEEQIQAINDLGEIIGEGMEVLSSQLTDINDNLRFLNRNMDIQIEQQKLSNLLLQNIAELLRVPDSEKERQHSIELGIKFFVNAQMDSDLYTDALEELLKAESLMKQDYFVLHRIGCIYLHVPKHINPEKALDYFTKAAKYASVESDPKAIKLANVLNQKTSNINSSKNINEITNVYQTDSISLLVADSYEKAAFSAYILGRFDDAVNYQSKAFKFNATPQNSFLLAKYLARIGNIKETLQNLDNCIDQLPSLVIAVFKEIDLIDQPEVVKLITEKNYFVNNKINILIDKLIKFNFSKTDKIIKELTELYIKSYEIKVAYLVCFYKALDIIIFDFDKLISNIDELINEIQNSNYITFDEKKINNIIEDLERAKSLTKEKMLESFEKSKKEIDSDMLKIGAQYAGGIVFYLDRSGKHGLVCADKNFEKTIWVGEDGDESRIDANFNGIADGTGISNTKKIVELASWYKEKGFFSTTKKPVKTAARLCFESNYNGFNDWYLPTKDELNLIYINKNKIGEFESGNYWSSSQEDWYVWVQYLSQGVQSKLPIRYCREFKWEKNVRAIRAF
jgi:tetratricopeptide (TPR) repeat protein